MVRIGATKCTGQRPTKGKRRRASDEGQTTMGKRRWASDDEQLTMAGVGSSVLHERKEKGNGTIRERERIREGKATWKRERKGRAFLSIHTQIVLKISSPLLFIHHSSPRVLTNFCIGWPTEFESRRQSFALQSMGKPSWPSEEELNGIKTIVSDMSKRSKEDVRVVVSPYRICPLGAHIDHQGGNVSAMAINKGVLLGFVPSGDVQVVLRSAQFKGDVNFRVDEKLYPNLCSNKKEGTNANGLAKLQEDNNWGRYARGAVYALQEKEHCLSQVREFTLFWSS
ncbi:galacturonokinase [Cucumis melo var. makuwa]|uniref:Galacturonokinase n=1 Tax=Cucumis melo var. makuwa TaxID=1194695 RepID=A0A5A7UQM8_CUCMM|nr:galacturonokinase [Cucumis melo var. makuwa]